MDVVDYMISNSSDGDGKSGKTFDSEAESVGEKIFASIKIIIGFVGFIGNITVCVVTLRLKHQKVHILIVTQAIADMLAALALLCLTITDLFPVTVPTQAFLGYLYCFFWQNHMILFFMFAVSTFNLLAISIERYTAVLHPIVYANKFSQGWVYVFAALAWVLGPMMQVTYAVLGVGGVHDGECIYPRWYDKTKNVKDAIGVVIFFWEFFFPCVIMGYCFTRIALDLHKRGKRWEKKAEVSSVSAVATDANAVKTSASSNASKQTRNVTFTLITVFAVYVICWSTDHFLFLQYNLGGYIDFNGLLYGFAASMAMLNSACNPIIYAFRYEQYRKELKLMCLGCKSDLRENSSHSGTDTSGKI